MIRYFSSFFLGYLLLEIISIAFFITWLGVAWTILIILVFSLLGFLMLRMQGLQLVDFAEKWANPKPSPLAKIGPIRYSLAALFLLIPGIFNSFLGLFLLLPIPLLSKKSRFYQFTEIFSNGTKQSADFEKDIIDTEFREVPSENIENKKEE